jgi:hypothetical protein
MPTFDLYFRETVIKRCHVTINNAPDVQDAIRQARLIYQQTTPEQCNDPESEVESVVIFAGDEFDERDPKRRVHSWELDGIDGEPGTAINIPVETLAR